MPLSVRVPSTSFVLRIALLAYSLSTTALRMPRVVGQNDVKQTLLSRVLRTIAFVPTLANAVDRKTVAKDTFQKALLNMPSQDFFYPPYMIGRWNTTLKFAYANFTDKVSVETLAQVHTVYYKMMSPNLIRDLEQYSSRVHQVFDHLRTGCWEGRELHYAVCSDRLTSTRGPSLQPAAASCSIPP